MTEIKVAEIKHLKNLTQIFEINVNFMIKRCDPGLI